MGQKILSPHISSKAVVIFPPEHILEYWRKTMLPDEVYKKCISFQKKLKYSDVVLAVNRLPLPIKDAR